MASMFAIASVRSAPRASPLCSFPPVFVASVLLWGVGVAGTAAALWALGAGAAGAAGVLATGWAGVAGGAADEDSAAGAGAGFSLG
jgi:hypothetical protein